MMAGQSSARGPNVVRTAWASFDTPRLIASRASCSNTTVFTMVRLTLSHMAIADLSRLNSAAFCFPRLNAIVTRSGERRSRSNEATLGMLNVD